MKFGKVTDPSIIDFTMPADHSGTTTVLQKNNQGKKTKIHIGCAKWNRQDLKGFYPRGTKDELHYYSRQFNSIELNATFYRIFPPQQVEKWYHKTPDNFRFFPKIPMSISQYKRLKNVEYELDQYLESIAEFKDKLGMIFLQMHPSFSPENFDTLEVFIQMWPNDVRLALELRHEDWYKNTSATSSLYDLLEQYNITHIITDTAGRRDLMHMRLTTPYTFIRYTGANDPSDYTRLDDWFDRLKLWMDQGIQEINFFVHQNLEIESPLLSAYLIKRLNDELGFELHIPEVLDSKNGQLF